MVNFFYILANFPYQNNPIPFVIHNLSQHFVFNYFLSDIFISNSKISIAFHSNPNSVDVRNFTLNSMVDLIFSRNLDFTYFFSLMRDTNPFENESLTTNLVSLRTESKTASEPLNVPHQVFIPSENDDT